MDSPDMEMIQDAVVSAEHRAAALSMSSSERPLAMVESESSRRPSDVPRMLSLRVVKQQAMERQDTSHVGRITMYELDPATVLPRKRYLNKWVVLTIACAILGARISKATDHDIAWLYLLEIVAVAYMYAVGFSYMNKEIAWLATKHFDPWFVWVTGTLHGAMYLLLTRDSTLLQITSFLEGALVLMMLGLSDSFVRVHSVMRSALVALAILNSVRVAMQDFFKDREERFLWTTAAGLYTSTNFSLGTFLIKILILSVRHKTITFNRRAKFNEIHFRQGLDDDGEEEGDDDERHD